VPGVDKPITRRTSLLTLGGLAAGALGWKSTDEADANAAVASGAVACVLTPEMTEGPYYVSGEKLRSDIRAGRPGTLLTLNLAVVRTSSCKPIKNAVVEIWHCDAGGTYSGVQGNRANFLRGAQKTNAQGVATFKTIYPGWYMGRAVHIHVKVHVGGNVVHTGQFFFNDALTDAVYTKAPYNTRGARDQRNAQDSIYVNGGSRSMLKVAKSGSGYLGKITMGVSV
jgi:protocatechuate 3,4-dioxygenase beta subunit